MVALIKRFHSIGYVHNDIKPENICIGVFANPGSSIDPVINDHQIKLIDFGISKPYLHDDKHVAQ